LPAVLTVSGKKAKDYSAGIPQHEIESLAQSLLPTMQAFFGSERGKRKFEEWKRKQAEKSEPKKN
jgi:hypothetical protein